MIPRACWTEPPPQWQGTGTDCVERMDHVTVGIQRNFQFYQEGGKLSSHRLDSARRHRVEIQERHKEPETMTQFKLEQVTGPLGCGEGPHWDSARKAMYLVDIPKSLVMRYLPDSKQLFTAKVEPPTKDLYGAFLSFILPVKDKPEEFLIGIGHSVAVMTWDGKTNKVPASALRILHTVESNKDHNRFNDAKTDPWGRVLAGTMGEMINGVWDYEAGTLYSVTEKNIKPLVPKIGIANGLAWSDDRRTFYYIDSLAYTVDAFDYNMDSGAVSNRRVVFDVKASGLGGLPDGMTIDKTGHLWVALYGGSGVAKVDPKTGKIAMFLPIPSREVTSVAFGGDNLDELYVTTADQELSKEEKAVRPTYGCTFKVTGLGVRGYDGIAAVL